MKTTAQDFIINNLDYLLEKLPYISIKYENDAEGNHFIEIKSIENIVFDNFIDKATLELFVRFVNSFPYENIAFLTEDDLCEIENPIYFKKGELFELANKIKIKKQNFALQEITQNYNLEFPKRTKAYYQDNFDIYSNQYLSSKTSAEEIVDISTTTKNKFGTNENYILAA